jgi:hypothetical protein
VSGAIGRHAELLLSAGRLKGGRAARADSLPAFEMPSSCFENLTPTHFQMPVGTILVQIPDITGVT